MFGQCSSNRERRQASGPLSDIVVTWGLRTRVWTSIGPANIARRDGSRQGSHDMRFREIPSRPEMEKILGLSKTMKSPAPLKSHIVPTSPSRYVGGGRTGRGQGIERLFWIPALARINGVAGNGKLIDTDKLHDMAILRWNTICYTQKAVKVDSTRKTLFLGAKCSSPLSARMRKILCPPAQTAESSSMTSLLRVGPSYASKTQTSSMGHNAADSGFASVLVQSGAHSRRRCLVVKVPSSLALLSAWGASTPYCADILGTSRGARVRCRRKRTHQPLPWRLLRVLWRTESPRDRTPSADPTVDVVRGRGRDAPLIQTNSCWRCLTIQVQHRPTQDIASRLCEIDKFRHGIDYLEAFRRSSIKMRGVCPNLKQYAGLPTTNDECGW